MFPSTFFITVFVYLLTLWSLPELWGSVLTIRLSSCTVRVKLFPYACLVVFVFLIYVCIVSFFALAVLYSYCVSRCTVLILLVFRGFWFSSQSWGSFWLVSNCTAYVRKLPHGRSRWNNMKNRGYLYNLINSKKMGGWPAHTIYTHI